MDSVDGWNVQRPREDLVVVLSESLAVQNGRLRVTTGKAIGYFFLKLMILDKDNYTTAFQNCKQGF